MSTPYELSKQIASGLDATTRLIQSLALDVKDATLSVVALETELKLVSKDVDHLSKTVHEGNGSQPIIARLAVLEDNYDQMVNVLAKIENSLLQLKEKLAEKEQNALIKVEEKKIDAENERHSKSNRWQFAITLITSIIALLAAILS